MDTVFDDQETGIGPQPGPQTILLACQAEEIFFGGALGAGKSYALGLALEAQHQRYGGKVSGICLRQSVPELDDLIKTFKEILEPFGWEYLTGKKVFRHPDGAECRMRHLEDSGDVRKYWGHSYSIMLYDELGDCGEELFNAVQKLRAARLRSASGIPVSFIATGNPCGAGHRFCKQRYVDPAPPFVPHKDLLSKHNIIFIPGRMENNIKMLMNDPTYRDRCKSMGPGWYVTALTEGDWTISPEGSLIHREWFSNRFDLENPPKFWFKVISWDTAFKTTKDSARSAATIWGAADNGFYLLYAWADKVEFPELKRKSIDLYGSNLPCNWVWIEDKASGQSLEQSLKEETSMPIKAIKVDGDKLRRAFAMTPLFESGKIFVPNIAPWLDEYIEELCSFPAPTGFSDYVDSTSQALTQLMKVKKKIDFFKTSEAPNFQESIFSR